MQGTSVEVVVLKQIIAAVSEMISDFDNGTLNKKARMIGRLVGEILICVIGDKGVKYAIEGIQTVAKNSKFINALIQSEGKTALRMVEGAAEARIFKIIKETPAEEVNKWWKEVMKYDNPPYKPGTIVKEIELTDKTTFVRVYDREKSGMYGGWVMKAEDIKGLTSAQIQDKFALPSTPKYVADVNLDAGTHLRTGVVNPLEGWGNGGGIQFDLMGQRTGEFVNSRPLP